MEYFPLTPTHTKFKTDNSTDGPNAAEKATEVSVLRRGGSFASGESSISCLSDKNESLIISCSFSVNNYFAQKFIK
jgi:hypothetical protein